jgi:hypothetical protein
MISGNGMTYFDKPMKSDWFLVYLKTPFLLLYVARQIVGYFLIIN